MTDEGVDQGMDEPDPSETAAAVAKLKPDWPPLPRAGRLGTWKRRVLVVSVLVTLLAAAVVLPPLINIGRYQRQITALMSRSLGRPVRLSSVELRLLPRPGFVLHDLSVSEDPAFGVEPVLSARTVVASVGIFPLWRGRLEVNRVSVDEASLNLVRMAAASKAPASDVGRWNLESLMMGGLLSRTAAASPGSGASPAGESPGSGKPARFPYLEATNSRVNLKNGPEKSPFSIVNADLSLWQDEPGAWRVRLRGEPERTDMEMSPADAGELRMEASLRTATGGSTARAAQLGAMPLTLQMEWREAQLGQLSRLLLGSDAGWRGDLSADIDVQGTLDAAQTKARLRATGVRREEFAPETPLDFDANCTFRYEHTRNALRNVGCDTAIGDGKLHLKADLPGGQRQPEAMLEVKQLPLQAGLDLLRTVRGGFAPGILARGTASGTLALAMQQPKTVLARRLGAGHTSGHGAGHGYGKHPQELDDKAPTQLGLTGLVTVEGGQLRGGGLKEPLVLPKMIWTPALASPDEGGEVKPGLSSRFTISLGSAPAGSFASSSPSGSPSGSTARGAKTGATVASTLAVQQLTVRVGLGAEGYDATISGSVGTELLRELAYAFGLSHSEPADGLANGLANGLTGGTVDLDLSAAGPWIASDGAPVFAVAATPAPVPVSGGDTLSGSLAVRHAEWKVPYLARAVELPQATVTLNGGVATIGSEFSYRAVKGSLKVNPPDSCPNGDCPPQVQLHFGALDASALQAALLGAPAEKTLLSPLIERMRSSDRPKWPEIELTAEAESLVLGPATLRKPLVQLKMKDGSMVLESWEAGLMGGSAKGTGEFSLKGEKPEYSFEGQFTRLSAADLGGMLDSGWTGGTLNGTGSIRLSGFADKELRASAAGKLLFRWTGGTLILDRTIGKPAAGDAADSEPAAKPVHFEDWTGSVAIQDGKAQLGENSMVQGSHRTTLRGAMALGGPLKLTVAAPVDSPASKHSAAGRASPKTPAPPSPRE